MMIRNIWATIASRYEFPDITLVGPRVQDTDELQRLDLMAWLWKINFNMLLVTLN